MEIRILDSALEKFIQLRNYKQFKAKLLKDRKIWKTYKDIGPEFELRTEILIR